MQHFGAQRLGKPGKKPKAAHPGHLGAPSAILKVSTRELERMPQSVESPIRLPPVELPVRFQASWAVQSVHALFGGLRRAWRWIEQHRPQQDKPSAHVRQCCSTPGDGLEGARLTPHKGVGDEASSSTLKTALDYLVKEQQLAAFGADSESQINTKTEELHHQDELEGQELAPSADSIAVPFDGPGGIQTEHSPNRQELGRRREIVREFFNDFWSSTDDKPVTFAERLNRAEGYINERLAANGEAWQLDPTTRKQLGLPRILIRERAAGAKPLLSRLILS
jgi:hypothetical protein